MNPGFTFKDFLTLNKFITPIVMTVVYWVLMVVAIVSSLVVFDSSALVGVLSLILAPLYVRMICELLILMFKIHGVLCEIRDQNQNRVS